MKIEAILWANAAMVDAAQLLRVEGGGWRYVERDFFPSTIAGTVCGIVEVEDEDFGSVHTLTFSVFDDAGQVDGSAGSITVDAREASEEMSISRLPFEFPFKTVLRGPTLLKASVKSNGGVLGGLSVVVRHASSPEVG